MVKNSCLVRKSISVPGPVIHVTKNREDGLLKKILYIQQQTKKGDT